MRATGDGADGARRGADGDDAGRDVAQDERTGTDDTARADGDAGENRRARANPDVFADADGPVVLESLGAQFRRERVRGGADRDVRADQGARADENVAVVHAHEIEVRVDAVAEVHVRTAPVGAEGRLDVAVLSAFGEDFPKEGVAVRQPRGRQGAIN